VLQSCGVDALQVFNRLHFNYQRLFYQQINSIAAIHPSAAIEQRHSDLSIYMHALVNELKFET